MASAPYYEQVAQAGNQFGVDPRFAESILESESGGNPNARSSVGAEGLMQIMPDTARGLARDLGIHNINEYDPEQNIRMGVYYLSELLRHFHGNKREAAAGYNAGGGAVDRYHGIPPYRETQQYVKTVMGRYQDMGGVDSSEYKWGDLAGGNKPSAPKPASKPDERTALLKAISHFGTVTDTFLTGVANMLHKVAPWEKIF